MPVDGVSGGILLHLLGAGVVGLHFGFGGDVLTLAGFELSHPGAGVHEEFGVVEAVLDEMQAAASWPKKRVFTPLPDAVKGWLCLAFITSEYARLMLKIQSPVNWPQLNSHSSVGF